MPAHYRANKTGMFTNPNVGMLGQRNAPDDSDAVLRSMLVGQNPGSDSGYAGGISKLDRSRLGAGPFGIMRDMLTFGLDVAPGSGDIIAGEESYEFGRKAQAALERGDLLGALDNWGGSAAMAVTAIPVLGTLARGTRKATDAVGEGIMALLRSQNKATEKRAGALAVKKGNLVGVPPAVAQADDPSKALTAHHRKMRQSARDGEQYRFWYELSQEAMVKAGRGDADAQRTLGGLLATFSQNTRVPPNARDAFRAAYQDAYGMTIKGGRFPNMTAEANRIAAGEDPLVVLQSKSLGPNSKRMNFYMNLYDHVEPSLRGAVTVDLWMARQYGYPNDTLTAKQVEFIQNDVRRIARELGWEPKQVQAAMWVQSLSKATGRPLREAGADFGAEAERMMGQISSETAPSVSGGHLPEYHAAPLEQQIEFHELSSQAFLDDAGNDMLAAEYGLAHFRDVDGVGLWEGATNPGTQHMVVMPEIALGKRGLPVEVVAQVEAYAAARGYLSHQDAVAWHRPFYREAQKHNNGVQINIGRVMTREEHQQIYRMTQDEFGHDYLPPITTERGATFLNFDGDNKAFRAKMDKVADRWAAEGSFDGIIDQVYFASEGRLVEASSEALPNGGNYQATYSGRGRSDLPGGGDNAVLRQIQERQDAVAAHAQRQWGWTPHPDVAARLEARGVQSSGSP